MRTTGAGRPRKYGDELRRIATALAEAGKHSYVEIATITGTHYKWVQRVVAEKKKARADQDASQERTAPEARP